MGSNTKKKSNVWGVAFRSRGRGVRGRSPLWKGRVRSVPDGCEKGPKQAQGISEITIGYLGELGGVELEIEPPSDRFFISIGAAALFSKALRAFFAAAGSSENTAEISSGHLLTRNSYRRLAAQCIAAFFCPSLRGRVPSYLDN